MAYILSKIGQSFNIPIHIYEADTEEDMNSIDIQSIPMGSKCHIINDDKWYMLNSDGKWKAMPKQVQPDWNQNDPTQPDYVKNRPFYTGDPVETVFVEESTVTFTENNGMYTAQFLSTFEATVGETYKVSWDGTVYECTCVDVGVGPEIGNLSIVGAGSDTGEPFVMGIINGEGIEIAAADTSASHTFSISGSGAPEVVKIDPKYIDDMYYTGILEKSIEGIEIANIPPNVTFDENLPLEIGQVWNVGYKLINGSIESSYYTNLEVQRAEDGTLYLGVYPDPIGYPFSITTTRIRSNSLWVSNAGVSSIILTGVSGTIHEEVVHQIPIKYIPDNPLNITGATVGQIAKITAVDDTGKPTSWKTMDTSSFAPAPFKPAGKSYLTFSSPSSFTLKVTKHWDGTLEYFASNKTWTTWDGTTILSSIDNDGEHVLYLRGTGNTVITGSNSNYKWVLTGSNIACIGNIENLLDYATVESREHPTMASGCYAYMFYGCTGLIQAPALPAITLANNCYMYMFHGCTSLTQAPELPATTLADWCYMDMFSGCTNLTQAPELPATTLASSCYGLMFKGCTSLTQAPALPATTLVSSCYQYMFQNCTSLTQAPALPANTLVNSCYKGMFHGCTSLTQAPELPATTLADWCYQGMFDGCTSLKLSSTQTGEYTQEYRIPSSGEGITARDALTDMFSSTGGTFKGTPSINTTYYLSSGNMIVRETEIATLNGYVGSMIDAAITVPASTTADNGKVLSVVDGAPSWTITSSEQAAISAANAEQSATIAQECAQAMAGTFDFTGYLRYQIVDAAPETYDKGVLYIVTTA